MDANIWFQDESAFGISLQSRFSWCQRCQRLHWYLSLQVFFNPTSCNTNIFWIGETIDESTLMPDYILIHLEQTLIPTGLLIYSPSVIKLMLLLLSWMKVPKLIQRRRHNFKLSWSSWEIHLWYYLLFELSRCSVSPLFNSASTIIIVTKIVTTTSTFRCFGTDQLFGQSNTMVGEHWKPLPFHCVQCNGCLSKIDCQSISLNVYLAIFGYHKNPLHSSPMDVPSKPLTIPSSQNFTNVQVYLIVPSIIISSSSQSSLPFLRVSVNSLRQNPRLIIPTLVCLYYSQPQCSIQEVQPLICSTNPQSLCSTNPQIGEVFVPQIRD